ncbi:MAG TPA: BtpA/SgcQ family protein [Bellilinea sp.]|nr:BtpA/SgcQ family protein [Bellilinea sp.]
MASLLKELFGVEKPVIAMAHIPALPGTPRYDPKKGVEGALEAVRADVANLLANGVDSIMFCNEDDRPYTFHADFEAVAVMTRIVTELRPKDRPFGVDFLWNAKAPLAICKATGGSFIREVVTRGFPSRMRRPAPGAAPLIRHRPPLSPGGRLFLSGPPTA